MASSLANIARIPELRKRIVFTLSLLFVYRLGIFVTCPGVDQLVMKDFFSAQRSGTLFGMFNMFSGGALENFSVFALGIMPYISASIIFSLLGVIIPAVEKLQKEGEQGRRKINQWTRYSTVGICIVQGLGISYMLEGLKGQSGEPVVAEPGWGFRIIAILTLTCGTIFIMWLGEQITERGIGNGTSLIIFAGIVANLPDSIYLTWTYVKQNVLTPVAVSVLVVMMIFVVMAIIFFERGQRRVPIQYAKRVVGRAVMGGQSSHLPLRVNSAGVIPPIFASSILAFPATLPSFMAESGPLKAVHDALVPGTWVYYTLFVGMIIFFAYFYTAVQFNPVDVAENLKKSGASVPGIRPGRETVEYLDGVLTRITFGGAMYMSAVCVLPSVLISNFQVPFYFGGTSLMIVVGVALDTVSQIESHLIARHYEGFSGARGPRIRGRRD